MGSVFGPDVYLRIPCDDGTTNAAIVISDDTYQHNPSHPIHLCVYPYVKGTEGHADLSIDDAKAIRKALKRAIKENS